MNEDPDLEIFENLYENIYLVLKDNPEMKILVTMKDDKIVYEYDVLDKFEFKDCYLKWIKNEKRR